MKRVAVLASHNGSTFKALQEAIVAETIKGFEIVLVISNNTDALALKNAFAYNIDNFVVNSKTHTVPDEKIEKLLRKYKCDIVLLSGYMKKLSKNLTQNFKIINSHPSLLPKYGGEGMYGRAVHEAVIKNKEEQSGTTFHIVNEEYDSGEILLQKSMTIHSTESVESLEEKVKKLEQIAVVELFSRL